MEMPILNGIELLKFIRADEKFKNLNVIMLTSVSDEEQIREALSQGIDNYVLKPINPNILQKRIAAALKL
jgi:two-component system chemotaxis response regulator CheY